jgi:hypothetical protein
LRQKLPRDTTAFGRKEEASVSFSILKRHAWSLFTHVWCDVIGGDGKEVGFWDREKFCININSLRAASVGIQKEGAFLTGHVSPPIKTL